MFHLNSSRQKFQYHLFGQYGFLINHRILLIFNCSDDMIFFFSSVHFNLILFFVCLVLFSFFFSFFVCKIPFHSVILQTLTFVLTYLFFICFIVNFLFSRVYHFWAFYPETLMFFLGPSIIFSFFNHPISFTFSGNNQCLSSQWNFFLNKFSNIFCYFNWHFFCWNHICFHLAMPNHLSARILF